MEGKLYIYHNIQIINMINLSIVLRSGINIAINSIIIIFLLVNISACNRNEALSCDGLLFGRPTSATGLSDKKCKPECACKDFSSKLFTPDELAALKLWKISTPFEEVIENPYKEPAVIKEPAVCAVVVDTLETKVYHLENFPDANAATSAGAIVTHQDACGVCSTLQDFAVYAENLDIGADVKKCGLANFSKPFEELVACIQELGFTLPCAQIWAYNTRNTQAKCLEECIKNEKYNQPSGALSLCLQCDEIKSGPVFKAVAGRTRRNTGIANSICRPCNEVQPIQHDYPK
jgi:hypothetical protein